jgi:predicted nucleotide-binding protein
MNVFLSWSGNRSKKAAVALRDWLPNALQAVQPWLSSKDAAVGKRWASSLAKALEEARIGIVCLTKENTEAKWLQFEAGALSRLSDDVLLCLYTLDPEVTDIDGPLSQFQIVPADRDGTFGLLKALNESNQGPKLPDKQLEKSFDIWWPELVKQLAKIPAAPANTRVSLEDRLGRAIELLEVLVGRRPSEVSAPKAAGVADAGKPLAQRPRAFIGSSSEGLAVARAIRELLSPVAECTVWQETFSVGTTVFESLNNARLLYDFAVIVLTPDDELTSRGQTVAVPRSNTIFELGFFAGALGRARAFFVLPADAPPKLPSDLSGVTAVTYRTPRDGNLVAALGPAVSQITRAMGIAKEVA